MSKKKVINETTNRSTVSFQGATSAVFLAMVLGLVYSGVDVTADNWRLYVNLIMLALVAVAAAGIVLSVMSFRQNKRLVHRVFSVLYCLYFLVAAPSAIFTIMLAGVGFMG